MKVLSLFITVIFVFVQIDESQKLIDELKIRYYIRLKILRLLFFSHHVFNTAPQSHPQSDADASKIFRPHTVRHRELLSDRQRHEIDCFQSRIGDWKFSNSGSPSCRRRWVRQHSQTTGSPRRNCHHWVYNRHDQEEERLLPADVYVQSYILPFAPENDHNPPYTLSK